MLDFKTYCENEIEKYCTNKIKKEDITKNSCKYFEIAPSVFRVRFKNIFKTTLTDYLDGINTPSRISVVKALIQSNNAPEFWENFVSTKINKRNMFESYFGVSTFERAKAKILLETLDVDYNPNISDNKSLVISQFLGDGSYDKVRGSFRISHGEKQFEYAYWKASLFNKAFPETKPAGNTKLHTHTQGHRYSSWYSGRIPSKLSKYLENTPKKDMVKSLTPFGMFLWMMDDGYINLDLTRGSNSYLDMYIHDRDCLEETIKYFKSFGVETTSYNSVVCIKNRENAVKLYKNFIEPFKNIITKDLLYKTEMKI